MSEEVWVAADAAPGSSGPPVRAIRKLASSSVHRICSGQVILDLATAVKELVENSLDAGATSVEVRLKDHGSELIEVADNGGGIATDDYATLAAKYHTSKLVEFADLEAVATFGFRGEALSSLCAVADVTVTTRRTGDAEATRLLFDAEGELVGREPAARAPGTTVAAARLFERLPVRRKEFLGSLRRELGKATVLLQAYAMFAPGVRLVATHHAGSNSRTTLVATKGASTMRACVVATLGAKVVEGLDQVDLPLGEARPGREEAAPSLAGFISKASMAARRGSGDRQFFAINGRPIDLPKFAKVLNDCFRTLASPGVAVKPICVLDLRLPPDVYDVNVTPDKRTIFLHDERRLLERLRQALTGLWEPSRSRYAVGGGASQAPKNSRAPTQLPFAKFASGVDAEPEVAAQPAVGGSGEAKDTPVVEAPAWPEAELDEGPGPVGSPGGDTGPPCAPAPLAPDGGVETRRGTKRPAESPPPPSEAARQRAQVSLASFALGASTPAPSLPGGPGRRDCPDGGALARSSAEGRTTPPRATPRVSPGQRATPESASPSSPPYSPPRDAAGGGAAALLLPAPAPAPPLLEAFDLATPRPPPAIDATVAVDPRAIRRKLSERADSGKGPGRGAGRGAFKAASLDPARGTRPAQQEPSEDDRAARELELVFNKADFSRMEVVGQFNLGFIVARLEDDLFIVDQHASDEKYNFERMQAKLALNRQPLIHPQELTLSPAEELTVAEHRDIFLANGFDFGENAESGRLELRSLPFSKNSVFSADDVYELVSILQGDAPDTHGGGLLPLSGAGRGGTTLPRPSRVRALLASRACRSSIMIGRALARPTMRAILEHLSSLASPWNCPHGRPTMRHLCALTD